MKETPIYSMWNSSLSFEAEATETELDSLYDMISMEVMPNGL